MPKISLSDQVITDLTTGLQQEDFYDKNFKLKGSFGVRVGLGGKKTFFLLHSEDGKRLRTTIGHFPDIPYKTALKLANKTIESSHLDSRLVDSSGPSLDKVSELFFKKSLLDGLDQKTLKEYRRLLEKEILPILGKLPIKKIKLGDIQSLLVTIALNRQRVPLSNRVRSLLGRILNFSIEMGYRVRNPAASTRPLIEKRTNTTLSLTDIRSLFLYLQTKNSVLSLSVLLSIFLMKDLRTILRFRWSDLRGFTILDSQGQKVSEIPLTETMLHILEEQRKRASQQSIFIFNSKRKGEIIFFEKALNKFGLDSGISPNLSSNSINKSIHKIVGKLLNDSNADSDLLNVYEAVLRNSTTSPKNYINLLLKWEDILKGENDNFSNTRSTKATGQLIMIPQSWWKKG